MVARAKTPIHSPAEYLAYEVSVESKNEYYDGEIVAMSGGSPEHDRAAVDAMTTLNTQLRGTPCEAFSSNMRVWVSACNCYIYPDISVACAEP